jgi:hypothetical protein
MRHRPWLWFRPIETASGGKSLCPYCCWGWFALNWTANEGRPQGRAYPQCRSRAWWKWKVTRSPSRPGFSRSTKQADKGASTNAPLVPSPLSASVTRSLIAGAPSSAKVSGLDLLVTIRLAAIHCLGGSFLPVDGMPSRILAGDRGQGPQPRSGPPTAAALRVIAGQGTMHRPSGEHRTSDSVRHVKFRRRHLKASLALQPNGFFRHQSSRAARVPAGCVVLSEVETSLAP